MTLEKQYPVHLLKYVAALSYDGSLPYYLVADEFLFATYLVTFFQGFNLETQEGQTDIAIILAEVLGTDAIDEAFGDSEINQEGLLKIVENLRTQFGEQLTTTYVKDFLFASKVYKAITDRPRKDWVALLQKIINMTMEMFSHAEDGISSITMNLQRLKKLMGLSPAETALIEISLLLSTDIRAQIFRDLFFSVTKNSSIHDHFYRSMLSHSKQNDVTHAFSESSTPIALGIVSYDGKSKRLSRMTDFWSYCITNYAETDEKFEKRFVEEIDTEKKKNFAGALAKVNTGRDEEILKNLLTKVTDPAPDTVVTAVETKKKPETHNILFYGSRKLDKLGYVSKLLEELKIKGYQVRTRDAKGHDIPAICYVAQKIVAGKPEPRKILVVGKAEEALTKQRHVPSWFVDAYGDDDMASRLDKELDSDEILLLQNPLPTIWMAHGSISSITPENVGRFLFHCELRGGSRQDRREEVEKVIKELKLDDSISQKLSKYLQLNVEQIRSASRLIEILGSDVPGSRDDVLLHVIHNSQRALDREKQEELRDSVTKYDLSYLNFRRNKDGRDIIDIERIIQALDRKRQGSLCFWGLPGTGKTQLAEYIAMRLDMPLLIKPASELLSKWLGESEKLIAEAFEEAKAENSILLIDEADSFLRDRRNARYSWEITQVNEMLQRIERFNGIVIVATNLFEAIDAAAVRRFTFKLEFLALRPEQRFQMLHNECGEEIDALKEQDLEQLGMDLTFIKHLTPGDFATVKRQANMLDEKLTLRDWIDRLNIESEAKLHGIERSYERAADDHAKMVTLS